MKLGFSLQENYALPIPQVIDLLADTGFCAVSPVWQPDINLKDTVLRARSRGLTVQSLHGPLRKMPAMWDPNPTVAQLILENLLQSATDCAQAEIPLLVVHPWNGVDYSFCPDTLCFDHFDTLVTHADQLGISIAFENLEGPEFLGALLKRYADCKRIGFCWDSGHELCYTPGYDFLQQYGDRLMLTHLNDNLGVTDPSGRLQGTDDLHLLPYDGIIDWDNIVHRLKSANPQEILNVEFKIRPKGDRCKLDLYSQLSLSDYFQLGYQRACQALSAYFGTAKA